MNSPFRFIVIVALSMLIGLAVGVTLQTEWPPKTDAQQLVYQVIVGLVLSVSYISLSLISDWMDRP